MKKGKKELMDNREDKKQGVKESSAKDKILDTAKYKRSGKKVK